MTARRAYLALGVLVIFGLVAVYSLSGTKSGVATTTVEAESECDSCSARKRDLHRLREVLNPPEELQD